MDLHVCDGELAIARLPADAEVPAWATGGFVSITRTPGELSIVCDRASVPDEVDADHGWRRLAVAGPLDFTMTGILVSIAVPLAEAHISVFAIATFETDHVLVQEDDLGRAVAALRAAGHRVTR